MLTVVRHFRGGKGAKRAEMQGTTPLIFDRNRDWNPSIARVNFRPGRVFFGDRREGVGL